MQRRSILTPLFLNIIPGLGHFYLGRHLRAFIYSTGFFGPLLLLALIVISNNHLPQEVFMILVPLAALSWGISFIDMVLTLILYPHSHLPSHGGNHVPSEISVEQQAKSQLILLSLIPGLGHYQLGLMHRGLTAMIAFFGSGVLILFVSSITNNEGFLLFLLALPVLWFYSVFDALQHYRRKQSGLELVDRSLFEDFHESFQGGKKNKSLATVFAVFPGAAHLYLGLQKRGLQFMALFLLSFYVMDVLRLSFFLFLLPLLWFFSFFDALQTISAQEKGPLEDKPLIQSWSHHQSKIGLLLIVLGLYYVFDNFIITTMRQFFRDYKITLWLMNYSQTFFVSLLLIICGIWLMRRQRQAKRP